MADKNGSDVHASGRARCLLIIPTSFYSYARILSNELVANGYEVTVANDEYPEGFAGKTIGKFLPLLSVYLTRRAFRRRGFLEADYSLAIVVKGRGVDSGLIGELRARCERIVGYNFDSFDYNRAALRWAGSVQRFCTFDYRDGRSMRIPIVELFSSLPPSADTKRIRYRFSAVMRNYSDRLRYLDRVLGGRDLQTCFIHIYESSRLMAAVNFARNPILYLRYRRFISFQPLPYAEFCRVLAASEYTIDCSHRKQRGVTMRCFEALDARTKVITNNRWLLESRYFNDSNSIVYSGSDPQELLKDRLLSLDGRVPRRARRSSMDFLNELTGGLSRRPVEDAHRAEFSEART